MNCLPASDPSLVARLQDQISSCGFYVSFVIEAAADEAIPESCDMHLACCDSLRTETWQHTECEDVVDNLPRIDRMYRNNACLGSVARYCGDAGIASVDEADGGADSDSKRHGLCCYQSCGYFYCT